MMIFGALVAGLFGLNSLRHAALEYANVRAGDGSIHYVYGAGVTGLVAIAAAIYAVVITF